ncbi:SDR family oxidoreductase [Allofrancisella guangzhouensis]|uniref:Short-chain dehydrogenase n=1 Tax=Allofrancisella guangzhouensis TaxID=594679 RepID=A0A0A8E547_9GAMM|nr:SDR family oxidoreductase [Allofrancisella guangzhouensis]AJC48727.1 hypothetical protein SD28_03255 [Allofrancisella guangzhouensis]MBK2027394.1 SDR family oxidoreductase [Allofrancisella guangzhouensis]MBK2043670.1 SDR family oxidoreductase [Allofrancisella guangzhouensis]MBK2045190.1 SDR family oxidoreductase [Allofrancisella guangzhouensis]
MSKLAIVTGGSKGIGKEVVNQLLHQGWQVMNLSRTFCELPGVINCEADLSRDDLKEILSLSLAPYLKDRKKVCIVHNACAYFSGTTLNVSSQELKQAWQVNITAPIFINQIIIPFMLPGSSILYVGSTLSEMAVPNCLPYVITKHASVGLMRSTCQDLSKKGIHTCCICPGFTNTETLQQHLREGGRHIDQAIENVAMKRIIDPKEIANFITYCVETPIVNGAVLHTNLGYINQ